MLRCIRAREDVKFRLTSYVRNRQKGRAGALVADLRHTTCAVIEALDAWSRKLPPSEVGRPFLFEGNDYLRDVIGPDVGYLTGVREFELFARHMPYSEDPFVCSGKDLEKASQALASGAAGLEAARTDKALKRSIELLLRSTAARRVWRETSSSMQSMQPDIAGVVGGENVDEYDDGYDDDGMMQEPDMDDVPLAYQHRHYQHVMPRRDAGVGGESSMYHNVRHDEGLDALEEDAYAEMNDDM